MTDNIAQHTQTTNIDAIAAMQSQVSFNYSTSVIVPAEQGFSEDMQSRLKHLRSIYF